MAPASETVRVWDASVRLFHWTLVTSVVADLAFEAGSGLHVAAGYVVLALLTFRMIWGLAGSRHARFSDFVHPPSAVAGYVTDLIAGRARRFLGHNPAGGAMIVVLLAVLAAAAISGALLDTDALWGNETLEHAHEAVAGLLYGLVPIHFAGVLVSSLLHRENLVAAMVTGRKRR